VGDDVPVNSDAFLVTDFINLKIKAVQSFRDAHRDSVYVRVFIGVSAHMCMCICVCHIFLKKTQVKVIVVVLSLTTGPQLSDKFMGCFICN
jgi:hypothetical protein